MKLNEINESTHEGRLLIAAVAVITTSNNITFEGEQISGTGLTPDEALQKINHLAIEIYKDRPQIKLQPFGPGKATNEPVSFENRLNQYEAILGFVAYLTTKTSGITVASGHNPRNVDNVIVDFCIANKFPKPKAGWEKMIRFPE